MGIMESLGTIEGNRSREVCFQTELFFDIDRVPVL